MKSQSLLRTFQLTWVVLFLALINLNCASNPNRSSRFSTGTNDFLMSSVKIEYTLGRDRYRLLVEGSGEAIKGKMDVNHHLIEERVVNPKKYSDFLKRALSFVQQPQRSVATTLPCHAPFTATVIFDNKTQVLKGCRSSENNTLSQLVREGEFLFLTKEF